MKKHYYLFIYSLIILSSYTVSGQKGTAKDGSLKNNVEGSPGICGADLLHNQKMESNAKYRSRYIQSMQSIRKISSQKSEISDAIYQIPVVVHVMHKGEPVGYGSNISDEDVQKGIKNLNDRWRKMAFTHGDGFGVDMKIEFVLAVQDENGECTNGINHVDMSGIPAYVSNGINRNETGGIADYDDSDEIDSLKEYSVWDTTKYYNIWIVDEIDNKNCYSNAEYFKGYAYYALLHGEAYDGTVILTCEYTNDTSTTLAHELGHAFYLQHTFNFDNFVDNGCGDDGIADTPSHTSPFNLDDPSCNNEEINNCDAEFNQIINPDTGFTRNSGTHQDHLYNYMNYSTCTSEFTGGQRAVARQSLSEYRSSFLTSPALTPTAKANVDFAASVTYAVVGETITFKDQSSCTPNAYTNTGYDNVSFLWNFNNGVDAPITSIQQNPEVTFNKLGTYDVTLQITNSEGTSSLTKTEHVSVGTAMVDVDATCSISSFYNNANFGVGVTNLSFHNLNNETDTFIPANALYDFTFYKDVAINLGLTYNLNVDYISGPLAGQFLEVWIDWDNSGTFDTSNSNMLNERVLIDNIPLSSAGSPSVSITPPVSAVLNTLLRMRVVSEFGAEPNLCGAGTGQRADDYGVYVRPACTSVPNASITNNSKTTVISCETPLISLVATGGDTYFWNKGLGNNPSAVVKEPGDYTVTVMSENGCSDTETITITYEKTASACAVSSYLNNQNNGFGVTNVSFNTINNATGTYIPADAKNDFICDNATTIEQGTAYELDVTYVSLNFNQYLEVWVDWDNNGVFQTLNNNGVDERVLVDNIEAYTTETASVSIIPPASAVLNQVLRMRVVSEFGGEPVVCGEGYASRADDYGVTVTNALSLSENYSPKFTLFPNPVEDYLRIDTESNMVINGYEIYDVCGKKVMSSNKINGNSINTFSIPNGFYFIKLKLGVGSVVLKFIKN